MEAEEGTTLSFSARHGASAAAIDRPLALRREDTVRHRVALADDRAAVLVAGQAAASVEVVPVGALAVPAEWAAVAEAAAMVAAQDADNNQLACKTE